MKKEAPCRRFRIDAVGQALKVDLLILQVGAVSPKHRNLSGA
jgi:hypothetical protein